MSKVYLITELLFLYVLLPLLFYLHIVPKHYIILFLIFIFICIVVVLARDVTFPNQQLWHLSGQTFIRPMLLRFGLAVILLSGFTLLFYPDLLFHFPLGNPKLWLLVMLLYPFLSAYPQEVICRLFFFQRYAVLFPNINILLLVNAMLFAWMHILFESIIVLVLSFIGGLLFAHTYHRTRSVVLVTVEHALYGNFLFTLGIGWFFYHGRVG